MPVPLQKRRTVFNDKNRQIFSISSLFPAQDRQVWFINGVMCGIQVSLKQRAKLLQKWSCRSMVKRYKTVIFPRQLKYNFYSTTEPGRYASVATILDPTFYKLYLLTISLAQRRYSCFSRLISVKGLGPVILPWKYQFSSDHWSKTWPGEVSTSMGDRLGIPRAGPVFLNSVSTKFTPYIYSFINKHKVGLSPNLNIQPIIFF